MRSEEIKNIITVLGTGVGKEEYDIEKIKYHKVIIMTDADVDGSHIRTLLLTFFYRQMKEVVDRGYLYIAQPPLFKIGKGKNEKYLKDETDFNDWILKKLCEKKYITSGNNGQKLSGHQLYLFVCDLNEYYLGLSKLDKRRIPPNLVELLINQGVGDKNFLQDETRMTAIRDLLVQSGYQVNELNWNEERDVFELLIEGYDTELEKALIGDKSFVPVKIGRGLIYSSDYQKCLLTGTNIKKHDLPPFNIFSIEKDTLADTANDKYELMELLLKEAKKGISIQRYKGLGEMNPDQLWHTTMNPEKRTLLQVKVEDMVDTDEIFTILMGEEVEPRREFIQNNALEVNTLDI